jgi:hypothetical protein
LKIAVSLRVIFKLFKDNRTSIMAHNVSIAAGWELMLCPPGADAE